MRDIFTCLMKIDKNIQKFYMIYFASFFFVAIMGGILFQEGEFHTKILLLVWIGIWFWTIIIPCIKDFSNAINRNYEYVEGMGSDSEKSKLTWRVITFDRSGNLKINVWSKKPYDKEYVGIYYLKNTKFGIIKTDIE